MNLGRRSCSASQVNILNTTTGIDSHPASQHVASVNKVGTQRILMGDRQKVLEGFTVAPRTRILLLVRYCAP